MTPPARLRRTATAVLVALLVAVVVARRPRGHRTKPELCTVRSVVCDATLMERGIIEPADTVPVRMGASGDILELLPSGTVLAAGTPVLRVDDAEIVTRIDEDDLNIQLEEIEATVRAARRKQTEVEQRSRLATTAARLRLARLEGDALRAGLSRADLRLLEIELRQAEIEWLEAHEETGRQRTMHERGFIADAVLERYVRRESMALAALDEKRLQIDLRKREARAEDLLENQRTVERYTADLERGESAMARRLAQIDAGIAVGVLELEQRSFDRARNAEELTQTTTLAATNGVLRVRMYSNWRLGGTWQPYAAGAQKSKHDTVADIVGRGSFRIDLMVHESDLHRVQPGNAARIRVGAFPDRSFVGRVTTVGGVGRDRQDVAPRGYEDSPSGVTMFNVEVRFNDTGEADLRPGMSAITEIVVEPEARLLLAPSSAVGAHGGGFAVRLPASGRTSKPVVRPVTGHPFDAHRFLIEGGLAEGDTILAHWTPP